MIEVLVTAVKYMLSLGRHVVRVVLNAAGTGEVVFDVETVVVGRVVAVHRLNSSKLTENLGITCKL